MQLGPRDYPLALSPMQNVHELFPLELSCRDQNTLGGLVFFCNTVERVFHTHKKG